MKNIVWGVLVILLTAVSSASAIPYYQGNVTGQCVTHDGVTYNVVANVTAPVWTVSMLTYTFSPSPAQNTPFDAGPKTRYFAVTPGNYTVTAGNPNLQGSYTITAPNCAPAPATKGMTWALLGTNPLTGTIRVGCKAGCDPHKGDTPCTTQLPMLCIRKSGAGFPLPVPANVNNNDQYNKWAGGVVATTTALVPPTTIAAANSVCAAQFGPDWRVAEFHDGWGWHFLAYGGIGDPSKRFWAHVNDSPGATCWK